MSKEINDLLETLESLEDGIYDLTGIEYIMVDSMIDKEYQIKTFIEQHPKTHIANAYETDTTILVASKPPKFAGIVTGSGFNYGSTNVIDFCPKTLLILAEND